MAVSKGFQNEVTYNKQFSERFAGCKSSPGNSLDISKTFETVSIRGARCMASCAFPAHLLAA